MNRLAYNPVIKRLPLGQYSLGVWTGTLAAGVNGEIFQFRWPDLLRVCAIRRLMLSVTAVTPFAAAPLTTPVFWVGKSSAWTVQGAGGTLASGTTTGSCRRRSLMPNSLLTSGDVRYATTVALGAGTKTFEAESQAVIVGVPVTTVTFPVVPPTDLIRDDPEEFDYPLTLAQNEGISIGVSGNPGTGTMVASVTMEWMETNGGA